MKKIMILALALTVLFSAPSCKRRPLSDADYNVNVVFNIDQDILNGPEMTEPEMMRVAFFDHNNGNLVAQAYLPPLGGQVSVLPGRSYDVLAYNFGTQVTFIQNENNFGHISATTNQIADSFKSKLKSRGTRSPGDETEETIVYDPDHLFVGRLMNVDMPARSVESPEVTLTIDCQTVVQSWILCVNKIKAPSMWVPSRPSSPACRSTTGSALETAPKKSRQCFSMSGTWTETDFSMPGSIPSDGLLSVANGRSCPSSSPMSQVKDIFSMWTFPTSLSTIRASISS